MLGHRSLGALVALVVLGGIVAVACGGDSEDDESGASSGGPDGTQNGPGGSSGGPNGTGDGGGDAPASTCDAFGRYGTPTVTYTIPVPTNGHISYPDIQKSLKDVDWSTIDRLYIPAGKYKSVEIGNLPVRDAAHPLIITNIGGQVQVGPNDPGAGFIWSMGGGSNWILTGRYDPDSKTGDVSAPGHRCGDYPNARGKYGFFSDDALDAKGSYVHMGLAVGEATSFEIEFLEIARSGFAGLRLLNSRAAGDPEHPMENVRIHDNYIHDTGGEGTYFGWTGGPPSNKFPKLQIYNNRFVRTGNEALQIQEVGEGSEIHHNMIGFASLHWRDNGLGAYQDNNSQIHVREGTIGVHHNVFMGGAATLLSFFSAPEEGDGDRHVTFQENYFADTLSGGGYLNIQGSAASSFTFDKNQFTGLTFGYSKLNPSSKAPDSLFGRSDNVLSSIAFTNNTWDGTMKLFPGIDVDGTAGIATASANTRGAVTPIAFVGGETWDSDPTRHLEFWAPVAKLSPGTPEITYQPGDRVVDAIGDIYECTATSKNETPADHPNAWKKLATPTDDYRVTASSPYTGYGIY